MLKWGWQVKFAPCEARRSKSSLEARKAACQLPQCNYAIRFCSDFRSFSLVFSLILSFWSEISLSFYPLGTSCRKTKTLKTSIAQCMTKKKQNEHRFPDRKKHSTTKTPNFFNIQIFLHKFWKNFERRQKIVKNFFSIHPYIDRKGEGV